MPIRVSAWSCCSLTTRPAQRDLFEQLLIHASLRGRRLDDAATLLGTRTTARPRNMWGLKHRAVVLDAMKGGAGGAQEAARDLERLRAQ